MRYLLSLLRKFSRLGRIFRRRGTAFRKYTIAPRQGIRAMRRRLLLRLQGRDASFSGSLEPTTEV
jgi:ribosomal protein S12